MVIRHASVSGKKGYLRSCLKISFNIHGGMAVQYCSKSQDGLPSMQNQELTSGHFFWVLTDFIKKQKYMNKLVVQKVCPVSF